MPCWFFLWQKTQRGFKDRVEARKTVIRTITQNHPMAPHYDQAGQGSPSSLKAVAIEVKSKCVNNGDRLKKVILDGHFKDHSERPWCLHVWVKRTCVYLRIINCLLEPEETLVDTRRYVLLSLL